MGSAGFQIHELDGGYDPVVSDIGVDIYSGPRASLAGTLPSWIAWWVAAYRYEAGHIVYMPGVYEKNYSASGFPVSEGSYQSTTIQSGDTNAVSSRRGEIVWDQSITKRRIQDTEELLSGGDMSRNFAEINLGAGEKQYFEYGAHTLWIKLFEHPENTAANDSRMMTDEDFFDKNKRRQNGWYCFHELMTETNLEIAFPDENESYSNLLGDWNNTKKRYSYIDPDPNSPTFGEETFKVVYGNWGEIFREIPCEPTGATDIEVSYDETVLNLCDAFVLLASNFASVKQLVNFVVSKSVIRSPGTLGQDESNSPVEIAIKPTNKITVGGNVLRSPKEISIRDTLDPTFAADNASVVLEGPDNQDEKVTIVSAGYPGIMSPDSILRNASNRSPAEIAKGYTSDEALVDANALSPDTLYLNKIKFGKMPAYDPRYGEASGSLNSYVSSLYNYSLPMSASSVIDFWTPDTSYKLGKAVRMSQSISEYNKSNTTKLLKDIIWVATVDHTSGSLADTTSASSFTSAKAPPFDIANNPVLENDYWRAFGVMANQPNSSLLQLSDVYRNSGVIPDNVNLSQNSSNLSVSANQDATRSALIGSSRRIRMSEMSGTSRMYASLTVCPAKEYDVKTFTKDVGKMGVRRRVSVSFRYPPTQENAAQADLWLYANNFRKDHAGQINFAVTFVTHTSFVWAQAKRRRKSWFGSLFALAFCLVGLVNPALFLTVGAECAIFGIGGSLAVGAMGGAIGLGIGTGIGFSAEAVYAGLGKGVGRKKAFSRSSFTKMVRTIGENDPNVGSQLVTRASNDPSSTVVLGASISADQPAEQDVDVSNENDIIRYNFGSLYPYLWESKENNTIHVSGEYQFLLQDLNSASVIKAQFNYEEISRRASRSGKDSFDLSFTGYPMGSPEGSHAGANASIYNLYDAAANNIISSNVGSGLQSTQSLKLIATRNYFNYLLIGPANLRDDDDPLRALTMWSMDLTDTQFKSLIGMMQTGFRDLDFSETADFSGQDGLSDYREFYKNNPPIAAAQPVAAKGYNLVDDGESFTEIQKLDSAGNVVASTTPVASVADVSNLNQESAEILSKAFVPGEFLLGKDFTTATPQYLKSLSTTTLWNQEQVNWSDISEGTLIRGGSMIKNGSNFYFVTGSFTKTSSSFSSYSANMILIPSKSSYEIYAADSLAPTLSLSKQWELMISSERYTELENDRGTGFYVADRKLDFSFIIKESAESSLIPLFLFSASNFIAEFKPSNIPSYAENTVVKLSVTKPIKGINGVILGEGASNFSESEIRSVTEHVFVLKKALEFDSDGNPLAGGIMGLKDESSWEYIGQPEYLIQGGNITWAVPSIKDVDNAVNPGDNLLQNGRCVPPDFFDLIGSRVSIDKNDADPVAAVTGLDNYLDFNYPWIVVSSPATHGRSLQRADGTTVYVIDPFSNTENTTINSTWRTLINDIYKQNNITHLLDSYLSNQLNSVIDRPSGRIVEFVIAPITDLTQKIEVWSPSNDYSEGDVVAFEYTNFNHGAEDLGALGFSNIGSEKFWHFARSNANISAGNPSPLFNDKAVATDAYDLSELRTVIVPIETKYWECATAREGVSPDSLASSIGAKDISASYYGTDLTVKSYTVATSEQTEYTQNGRSPKTPALYIPTQREIDNVNVNTFFDPSYSPNTIFTTTRSVSEKIVGRLPVEHTLFVNEGGTWPGERGNLSTSYLTEEQFNNLYPANPLIQLFLSRTQGIGAKWSTWINSNPNANYSSITFSQGDEYQRFETMPSATLAVKHNGQYKSKEIGRAFSDDIPVFHRGYDIELGIRAQVSDIDGDIAAPSSASGSNLFAYISSVFDRTEVLAGGTTGKISFVPDGDGTGRGDILDTSGTSIKNTEISTLLETLKGGDQSGFLQYGNECLSNEITVHSISGINRTNFVDFAKIRVPENSASLEPGNAFARKSALVLATRDSNDGLTKNKTKLKNFLSSTGINYQFDNWFAQPDQSGNFVIGGTSDAWPDNVVNNEDFSVIKIDSKINNAKEAARALLDVSGGNQIFTINDAAANPDLEATLTAPQYYELLAEDASISSKYTSSQKTHENVAIDFSDTLTDFGAATQHYHGRAQATNGNEGLPWDAIGFGYLNNILKGMGDFIAAQVNSDGSTVGFNDSGLYLGGTGLTQTSLSGIDFYVVSQPAFFRGRTHGVRVNGSDMFFYNGADYDFKILVSCPSLLYKKYVNKTNAADIICREAYAKLFDENCPGGGDSKSDFNAVNVFNPTLKLIVDQSEKLNININTSSKVSLLQDGYNFDLQTNKSEMQVNNNSSIVLRLNDNVSTDTGRSQVDLALTARFTDPPSFGSITNNINGTLYYYIGDATEFGFGVTFPMASEFGGRVAISELDSSGALIGSAKIFESTSGAPSVNYSPNTSASSISITVDDGIPFGFGKARSGGHNDNLTYPSGFSPVNNFQIRTANPITITPIPSFAKFRSTKTVNGQDVLFIYNRLQKPNLNYISLNGFFQGGFASIIGSSLGVGYVKNRDTGVTGGQVGSFQQMFGFANLVYLTADLFPETGDIANFSLYDNTGLGDITPSAKVDFETRFNEIDKPAITITRHGPSSYYKLWESSEVSMATGDINLDALITSSPFSELTLTTSVGSVDLTSNVQEPDGNLHFAENTFASNQLIDSDDGEIIEALYETLLGRASDSFGFNYYINAGINVGEMISSLMGSGEYLANVSSGTNLADPTQRKRLSFTYDPSEYIVSSIGVQDNIFLSGGLFEDQNLTSFAPPSPPIWHSLYGLYRYQQAIDANILNPGNEFGQMANQCNVVFPSPSVQDVNNPGTTFADTQRRRYCGAGPSIGASSYAELKTMMVSYQSSQGDGENKLFSASNRGGLFYQTGNSYSIQDSRIKWVPTRHGSSEPNIWMYSFNKTNGTKGLSFTCSWYNGAIDLCANSIADRIFDANAKWIPNNYTPSLATHGDGITYDNFTVWNSRNYNNSSTWETIIGTNQYSNQLSKASLPSWTTPDANQDWLSSSRIEGWAMSSPHKSFIDGYASSVEDPTLRDGLIIKNGSATWGGLELKDMWVIKNGLSMTRNWFNLAREGYIGLQLTPGTPHASRITKFVSGLFPGVTYRFYIALALRPQYGKSGARVYIVEPSQSESETGELSHELIGYGEFTCKHSRSIDYNAKNHLGGIGVQTNFAKNNPFAGNTADGSENVTNDTTAAGHSLISDEGFKLFYVDFTPTLGSRIVEIRIEHAFVNDVYLDSGGTLINSSNLPSGWKQKSEEDMFNSASLNRANWTEYSGVWASNEQTAPANTDQTVFIADTYIKSVRPLYEETISFTANSQQGGYEILINNGDSENASAPKTWLRSPNAAGNIFKKMASTNYAGASVDIFDTDDKYGWFEGYTYFDEDGFEISSAEYESIKDGYLETDLDGQDRVDSYITASEYNSASYMTPSGVAKNIFYTKVNEIFNLTEYQIQIIRPHTHLFNWDPFGVDCQNRAASKSNQGYVKENFLDAGQSGTFHPNLLNGYYLGHACFFNDHIYRLKSVYRSESNSAFINRRPGYGNWEWSDDFNDDIPGGGISKWESISDMSAQELIDDAAAGTGNLSSSWYNEVKTEHELTWSAHVFDAILRRPFVGESLDNSESDYFGSVGTIHSPGFTLLNGGESGSPFINPFVKHRFSMVQTSPIPGGGSEPWGDIDNIAGFNRQTPYYFYNVISRSDEGGSRYNFGFVSGIPASSTLSLTGTDARFQFYFDQENRISFGPNYPFIHRYQDLSGGYYGNTQLDYGGQEILIDPLGVAGKCSLGYNNPNNCSSGGGVWTDANAKVWPDFERERDPNSGDWAVYRLDEDGTRTRVDSGLDSDEALDLVEDSRSNAAATSLRFINHPENSRAYTCGSVTSIFFSNRGATREERILSVINTGLKRNGLPSNFVGDHVYAGHNPVAHKGWAYAICNGAYLSDYESYDAADTNKYLNLTISNTFYNRGRDLR